MKKKIYFAGIGCIRRTTILLDEGFKNFMCSFANKPSRNVLNLIRSYPGTEIMLDSGAFSAWNAGKQIDIDKYIEFIRDNNIDAYFNLDVIGDVEGTIANQHYMELQGLHPIPVYHYGEPFEYLDWLVNQGYTYIGLGGTVGKSVKQRQEFFDEVFARHPHIDFHGLGVTSKTLVENYNWYSCDSTTWLAPFKNKRVMNIDGSSTKREDIDATQRFYESMDYFRYLNNLDREE
jgi:hypothetical protein